VIADDQTICEGDDVAAFTSTTDASGDGTITYQWQSSTTSAVAGFSNIGGATSATFNDGTITQDTWYKRIATSTLLGKACTEESNVIKVTVNALPVAPVSGGNITECKNPSIQTLTATATVPAGQHIDWYNAATAGAIVVSPTLNTVGTVTYYAQTVNNDTSCISLTRTAVTLTINACSIVIAKDGTYQDTTAPIGITNPGDTVTYAFVVTNTGNVPLTNVTITDPLPGLVISGGPITLAVGASDSTTFTATYEITQVDIDAGAVYNLATATGTPPSGPDVNHTSTDPTPCTSCPIKDGCEDCTITPLTQTPDIAIVKTNDIIVGPNGCAILKVGDVVTYTFTVTNEGNVSLHDVAVEDLHTDLSAITLQSGDVNNISILEVGETWIYTATYTVTQTDIDNGNITNQASVKGTAPDTTIVTDLSGDSTTEDRENVIPICTTPDIAIVKTNDIIVGPNGCAILKVGDVVTYTFTVTNEGNVSLHDVAVEDLHTDLSAITLQSGDVNNISILEVGETWIYTATYTVTQTDIDNGNITNQASVKGTAPDNTTIVTDKSGDSATEDGENVIPICTTPDIAIVKTNDITVGENGCAILKVGDVVTYTFTVTNEGNVSLHDVAVADPHPGLSAIALQSGDVNDNSIVEVTETWIYTATYTVTQADIDAGTITNQASVNGTAPDTTIVTDLSGDSTTDDDPDVIPICTTPEIAIVKTNNITVENGCATLAVGNVVIYTFTVTNEGNVSLHDVTVTDPHTGLSAIALQSGDVNNNSILEVTETWSYTATYTVTQADIDAGNITNQASVSGTAPDTTIVNDLSGDSTTDDDPDVIPICTNPDIAIVKTNDITVGPNGCAILKVGDVVTYTFTVTNEGNVSLHDVAVEDLHTDLSAITLQSGDVNNISILEVGETWIYTATYTVTQTDIDNGNITNQASVKGTAPDNTTIVTDQSGDSATDDDPDVIPICINPDIALVKTGTFVDTNNDGFAQVGEKINYTFAVTNTGNVTVTNIVITDPLVGLAITGSPIASLIPGATDSSVTGVYTVTQADINAGQVTNSALAIGKDPKGGDVRDISGTTVENDTPTVTPLNNIITITSACTSSTETRNLNDYLPAGTPTDGIWTDVSGTGQLVGSIVSPFGLAITSENNPYVFEYKIGEGTNFGNIRLLMSVDNECFVAPCRTIIVHNAFSPNGDGINEVFIIENITDTCYIDNTVEIYNRWGVLVFDTRNYDNESNYFDGISRGRTTISQSSGLPTGTYYYILNYTSVDGFGNIQTNKKDGYLYLTR
ncbi:gliding motility-associated C-terminal domain-containing protein, partial [Flavobacterium sp. ZB4R12]|uniref:DUF7507 domain-containing protein n=1 Tax=Flavobacterium sp. ZB4R12 TaxID=3398732 RepID=UPI003AAB46FA